MGGTGNECGGRGRQVEVAAAQRLGFAGSQAAQPLDEHGRRVPRVDGSAGDGKVAQLPGGHDQVGIDPVVGGAFGFDGFPRVPLEQPAFAGVGEHRRTTARARRTLFAASWRG